MAIPSARPGAALDFNVLNALLRQEPNAVQVAAVLGQLQRTYALVICPVVYAELLAGPGATVPVLQGLLTGSGVALDLNLPAEIWERAGQAYGSHARRRQGSGGGLPRRLLADFVVGAHAEKTCTTLVTLDPQHYRLGFPGLNIVVP